MVWVVSVEGFKQKKARRLMTVIIAFRVMEFFIFVVKEERAGTDDTLNCCFCFIIARNVR